MVCQTGKSGIRPGENRLKNLLQLDTDNRLNQVDFFNVKCYYDLRHLNGEVSERFKELVLKTSDSKEPRVRIPSSPPSTLRGAPAHRPVRGLPAAPAGLLPACRSLSAPRFNKL